MKEITYSDITVLDKELIELYFSSCPIFIISTFNYDVAFENIYIDIRKIMWLLFLELLFRLSKYKRVLLNI